MKSFKPSRSIPSLGIPEILKDGGGKQGRTLIFFGGDVRVTRSGNTCSKSGGNTQTA